MHVPELIDHLQDEGPRLLAAAQRAGWDAPVPRCEWDVRTLVVHTGGVHRWATTVVGGRPVDETQAAHAAVGTGPSDAELPGWFLDGHAALVTALREAPEDLEAYTFLPALSHLHFWARRQAHETAMHRADAEAAAGQITPFDLVFAQDGIAEMLQGFAARRSTAIKRDASMALRPTDGGAAWRLTFGGERTVAEQRGSAEPADTVLTGTSSDLCLWLWNRPSAAEVHGDAELAGLWAQTVRVHWG